MNYAGSPRTSLVSIVLDELCELEFGLEPLLPSYVLALERVLLLLIDNYVCIGIFEFFYDSPLFYVLFDLFFKV